eukprot:scaffold2090_cov225-Prasinococcus_capsulatus_cf.AAC.14
MRPGGATQRASNHARRHCTAVVLVKPAIAVGVVLGLRCCSPARSRQSCPRARRQARRRAGS